MSDSNLKETILSLLEDHPSISISTAGHAAHALRFIGDNGKPLALEPERTRFQNLWARLDSVNLNRLIDIEHKIYRHTNFDVSKPNHNLFGESAFKSGDLVCFQITNSWHAVRIIFEVIGYGEHR
jgi:hypothetical protein